ncbi:putative quinone-oxidoreductase like chloroplastic [Rosellinia necatrix]|uniref:Putative quinone-oxidoreductase like chloroplastic n=1 Tax=Rosellinia necatrix TaxID=77044 RepID=A0A1S8A8P4_ROSNE|nr:putative quinone-oxidoreductase like chloroplastic [Rosellinia necatrix]
MPLELHHRARTSADYFLEDKLPCRARPVRHRGRPPPSRAHTRFQPGDKVYALVIASRPGNTRQCTLARTSQLAFKSKTMNFIATAATPLSALMAWQLLFAQDTLNAAALMGDKACSDHGAGGGGGWVVHLAWLANAGAVFAICGKDTKEIVQQRGAVEIIDYT